MYVETSILDQKILPRHLQCIIRLVNSLIGGEYASKNILNIVVQGFTAPT